MLNFSVTMSCSGCENAIKRILLKKNKELKIETNLEKQLLSVDGDITGDEVIEALKSWCESSKKEIKIIDKI